MAPPLATPVDRPLWVTLPGAPAGVAVAWLGWLGAAVVAGAGLVPRLGPAGTVILVLALGWALARRAPSVLEAWRRYHLDAEEITVMGPGRRVRRLPWSQVGRIVQGRRALSLNVGGTRVDLPLAALVSSGAWGAVIGRVVPAIAARLWVLLDDAGEVRLASPDDPPRESMAWWAYAPACVACAAGAGTEGLGLAIVLATGEWALAHARRWLGVVRFWRTGLVLRSGLRRLFVAWPQMQVTREAHGLAVSTDHGASGFIPVTLANFWAVAPVVEMKARLGAASGALVHFRVRLTGGRLAVIGEVEPQA